VAESTCLRGGGGKSWALGNFSFTQHDHGLETLDFGSQISFAAFFRPSDTERKLEILLVSHEYIRNTRDLRELIARSSSSRPFQNDAR
jgi:hypothetical protein